MNSINQLALHALLLDTITYLKHGKHLHPTYKASKYNLCRMSGQKTNITSKKLLTLIGLTYRDNDIEAKFWSTIDKFDAAKYLD